MLMRFSIFGEKNLFDDFFNDFPFYYDDKANERLIPRRSFTAREPATL